MFTSRIFLSIQNIYFPNTLPEIEKLLIFPIQNNM